MSGKSTKTVPRSSASWSVLLGLCLLGATNGLAAQQTDSAASGLAAQQTDSTANEPMERVIRRANTQAQPAAKPHALREPSTNSAPALRASHISAALPGQLLLQLRPGAQAAALLAGWRALDPSARLETLAPQWSVFRLDLDPEADLAFWLKHLRSDERVQFAQYNHRLQKRVLPSDPGYGLQWSVNSGASVGGVEGPDIDAPGAWDLSTGGLTCRGDTVVIAVIDDGFDLRHEDLWFWENRHELPDDGLDNDGNGYVDDVQGWNASNPGSALPVRAHGTHVCGIAAARGNNGIGITGVNWNAPILPVYAALEEDDVVAAYAYVHAMRRLYDSSGGRLGAFVVVTNSSFGLDYAQPEDFPIWCSLYDSLGSAGILSAAATINSLVNVDAVGDVPTACASRFLISVTNTNNLDELRTAGYGKAHIDLAAPGTGVYSTLPLNQYGYNSGTSMATPHVAGTIALMVSAACPRLLEGYLGHPEGIALAMKDALLLGVSRVPDLEGASVSGGRINMHRSLEYLLNNFCRGASADEGPERSTPSSWSLYPNPAQSWFSVEGPPQPGQRSPADWQLFDAQGRRVLAGAWMPDPEGRQRIERGALPPGLYFFLAPGAPALPLTLD